MFFNSGIRGARARDGVGSVANRELFVQKKDPVPSITSWAIQGSDDTSLDPAGGQTVVVTGTGFASGLTGIVGSTTLASVTVVSPTTATFTSTAKSAGSYTLILSNASGAAAIYVPGITYSSIPTYTTAAGSIGSNYETTAISTQVVATSDSAITYSLATGALPSGSTLYANGVITGTAPVDSSSTTYSFSITATDAELQDVTRSFTLTINTDVVTWSSPGSGTTYTVVGNTPISNVTLSATSAAGYGVTYTANALPTGVTLSSGVISGTPTVESNITSLLTATASTTNRSATNTIYWVVTLNDAYFKYNSLLMSSTVVTNTFATDLSSNNLDITVVGDTKPSKFDPFELGYYSNYFDGTGDYLATTGSTAYTFGTGDFTVELWVYLTTLGSSYRQFAGTATSSAGFAFGLGGSNKLYITTFTNGTESSGTALVAGQWYHCAWTRSSGTVRMFLNGVLDNTTAGLTTNITETGGLIGGQASNYFMNGYISNHRVVNGTALYTATFTPSTTPLTAVANTSLLTCQSSRFIDTSANAFTITVNGNTLISSFQPFTPNSSYATYGSTLFDGTGDYLSATPTSGLTLTGNFTIEFWVYFISLDTAERIPVNCWNGGAGWLISTQSNAWNFKSADSFTLSYSSVAPAAGQWYHVAVTRSGSSTNNVKMFINGTQVTQGTTTSTMTPAFSSGGLIVGGGQTGSGQLINGYVSNLRIVNGTAVYTATFTPSTTPLTAITNTSLLTCQTVVPQTTSVFVDESSFNNSITRNGNTNIGTFSPLNGSWSNYFDGTGDYLQTPSSAFSLGTVFTVEAWVYPTISPTNAIVFSSTSSGELSLGYYSNTGFGVAASGVSWLLYSGTMPVVGAWNHIAVVRAGLGTNQTSIYINGTRVVNGTISNAFTGSGAWRVGFDGGGGASWTGYISNLRVVAGTDVYGYTNTTITPSTTPLNSIANTKLLTCNSPSFVDYSPINNVITKNGDTAVNKFSPFPGYITNFASYSGLFDGTGDYLSVPSNAALQFGTGDFTIEGWIYQTAFSGDTPITASYQTWATSVNFYFATRAGSPNVLVFRAGDSVPITLVGNTSIPINTWTHVAVARSSSVTKIFVNGVVQTATHTGSVNISATALATGIGASQGGLEPFTGYISNLRFIKGTAVYTTNFTPSTVPLTAIANTSLLTCQSTTFIDNSTNAFTITVIGDAKPVIQNPFVNTFTSPVAYSPTTVGTSMYFDGTGDYLSIPHNTNQWIGANTNFTIECWAYFTSSSANQAIVSKGFQGSPAYAEFLLWLNASSGISFLATTNGGGWQIEINDTVASVAYTWNHYAVVRNGSTITLYKNGISVGTPVTNSGALYNHTAGIKIGSNDQGTNNTIGYISNVRFVKGTAVYTGPFVPSNSPLPAVQNTVLLVSSTITPPVYDAAEINDIENVGTSKLTASNSPYYSSYSGQFDGTGDYLTLAANAAFGFGTGDFTVEMWIYPTSTKNTQFLFDTRDNGAATGTRYALALNNTTSMQPIISVGTGTIVTSSQTVAINSWYHIAFSKASGTVRLFINGTQVGSVSSAIDVGASSGPAIGTVGDARGSYDGYFAGYISNLRVVKGTAVYTSNFTPSTTPLTAIANTSLLTCQSNRFIDNSTNAFTITRNGDAKVSALQPFGGSNLTKYSSVYFDGTGDSLKILNNPNINLGSGDFTLECWVYFNAVNIQVTIINKGWNSSSAYASYLIWMQNDATLRFLASSNGSSWDIANEKVMGTMTSGSWIHIAVTRSGTTFRAFVNGVINNSFTFTSSASLANIAAQTLFIGDRTNGDTSLNGYISDVRITNGYARYTTTFTPPTVPLLGF